MTWNYFGLTITSYSERSFVVRGEETKKYKEDLKKLGGRWNPRLKGGAGWIFSNKKEKAVNDFIMSVDYVEEKVEESTLTDSEEKEDIRVSDSDSEEEFIIRRRRRRNIIEDSESDTDEESDDEADIEEEEEDSEVGFCNIQNTLYFLVILCDIAFFVYFCI